MNTSPFKTIRFWATAGVAIFGVLVSQGVVIEGSMFSTIVGWAVALLSSIGTGHQLGTIATEKRLLAEKA